MWQNFALIHLPKGMLQIEPDANIAPWGHSCKALFPSRCSRPFGIDDGQLIDFI